MKTTTIKIRCDACRKSVPSEPGDQQRLVVRMRTHGYDLMDGDHRERFDICSPECGLKLLRKWIDEIEASS